MAQGDILYRGASAWGRLAAGSAGQVLQTNGGAADPSWVTPGISGAIPYDTSPFAIPDALNDNFAGASLDTTGARFSGASSWAWLNQGSATATLQGRKLWLTSPASASLQIRGIEQTLPSGDWCYRMYWGMRNGFSTLECSSGLFLRDSSGGKIEVWGAGYSGGSPLIWSYKMTNATTYSASRASTGISSPQVIGWLEIEKNAGTGRYYLRFGLTSEGNMLQNSSGAYDFTFTDWLGSAADKIGIFSENDQSVANTLICGGFYRVATSVVLK